MEIGKVDDVNPRALWANEARDFTPWLLENADVLSKALGLEVSLRSAEHPVGDFSRWNSGASLFPLVVLLRRDYGVLRTSNGSTFRRISSTS